MTQKVIRFLENVQMRLDFENQYWLGIDVSHWAHFFVAFLIMTLLLKLKRPLLGVVLVVLVAFLKELIDLGVIYYYEPIQAKFWLDSSFDIFLGFLGIATGFMVPTFFKTYKSWTLIK